VSALSDVVVLFFSRSVPSSMTTHSVLFGSPPSTCPSKTSYSPVLIFLPRGATRLRSRSLTTDYERPAHERLMLAGLSLVHGQLPFTRPVPLGTSQRRTRPRTASAPPRRRPPTVRASSISQCVLVTCPAGSTGPDASGEFVNMDRDKTKVKQAAAR
jgi:hypothetical protein